LFADLRWQRILGCANDRAEIDGRDEAREVSGDPSVVYRTGTITVRRSPGRAYRQRTRNFPVRWLLVPIVMGLLAGWAQAQGPTVDTSVPVLPGSSTAALPGSNGSLFGQAPGAAGSSFNNLPGTGGFLGGRPGASTPRGIPTTITTPGAGPGPTDLQMPISSPQPAPVSPTSTPFYGTLELVTEEGDGPKDGLTLDRAIEVTLDRSLDLLAKKYEISMGRADILQASLRANPIFYQDGQLLQYKGTSTSFSRMAPGGPSQYDTNISYPLDISHKRQARTNVAARAERVLEALFQDAVRQRIDDIYGAYVTALANRQTVRYARSSVKGLVELLEQNETRFNKGDISKGVFSSVKVRLRTAQLGLLDAEAAYRKSKRDLGGLMNLTLKEIESLELNGSIQDVAPPPPPAEVLRQVAVAERPDIVSFRLAVLRAEADVQLAKANAYSDVYVLWQPYTFQDNTPYGLRSQYSWALGVTIPIPIYNRNQGGILRAKDNVSQTRVELADLERQARIDVESALQEYEVTRRQVRDMYNEVVPDAASVRDEVFGLYKAGVSSVSDYLDAQFQYNLTVKQYLDTAVRHRRSMLSLNTVLGRRIMP
jgi:cobalt-zinc-cadmium efflux system outer membrane protein